jgi:hypothetical protein
VNDHETSRWKRIEGALEEFAAALGGPVVEDLGEQHSLRARGIGIDEEVPRERLDPR